MIFSSAGVARTVGVTVLAASTWLAPTAPASAQGVVRFEAGGLLDAHLPYGRKFIVRGPTALPRGRADVVRVRITPKEGSSFVRPAGGTARGCWVRPLASDGALAPADSFDVFVDALLRLDDEYEITLEFFQRFADQDPEPLVTRVRSVIADSLLHGTWPATVDQQDALIEAVLAEEARSFLESKATGDSLRTLQLGAPGRCPDVSFDAADAVSLSTAGARAIRRAAVVQSGLVQAAAAVSSAITDYNRAISAVYGDPAVRDSLTALARRGSSSVAEGTVSELYLAMRMQRPVSDQAAEAVRSFLAGPDAAVHAVIDATREGALESLLNQSRRLARNRQDLRDRQTALVDSTRAAVDEVGAGIREQFFLRGSSHLGAASWTDETELESLKWGTSYALGGAWSDAGAADGETDGDLFTAVILRYHPFGEVDKSLPAALAYSGWWARVGLDVGAVSASELTFGGRDVENALSGLKPLLGASFDFTPDFALHAGWVFFDEPPGDDTPAGAADNPRTAFYLMLGWDSNLINTLTKALGSVGSTPGG